MAKQRYMIVERFHPEKVRALYERFDRLGRLLPAGVDYIDSWIDEKVETCYQLMESESPGQIHEWIQQWNDLADFEIVPIINSEEAKRRVFAR